MRGQLRVARLTGLSPRKRFQMAPRTAHLVDLHRAHNRREEEKYNVVLYSSKARGT